MLTRESAGALLQGAKIDNSPKMRIRIRKGVFIEGTPYGKGEVVMAPRNFALKWIQNGHAMEVTEEPEVEKPKRRGRPPKVRDD